MHTPPPSPAKTRPSILTDKGKNFRPHLPGLGLRGSVELDVPCHAAVGSPYPLKTLFPSNTLRGAAELPGRLYFTAPFIVIELSLHQWHAFLHTCNDDTTIKDQTAHTTHTLSLIPFHSLTSFTLDPPHIHTYMHTHTSTYTPPPNKRSPLVQTAGTITSSWDPEQHTVEEKIPRHPPRHSEAAAEESTHTHSSSCIRIHSYPFTHTCIPSRVCWI